MGALGVHAVTNGDDSGAGSYRDAITAANGDGDPVTINIAAGLTVTLTSGDVVYTNAQPIVINGNGSIIDGSNAHQILEALATSSVTVNDITMRNGDTAVDGGAIEADGADITVNNSTFSGNTAGENGGATRTSSGNYTITNSAFSGNTASDSDGGATRTAGGSYTITNSTFSGNRTLDGEGGAAWTSGGDFMITNSTFSGNTASDGDGGATRTAGGSYTITNSTFSGNTSTDRAGGATWTDVGSYAITNSTFSGNTAPVGEGGAIRTDDGEISLTYVTMSANTAPTGAHVFGEEAASSLVAFGSVLADPLGGGANCSIAGTTTSNGYNYSTDASCGFTGTGDTQSGAAPQLGALANNGGPTQTMLPAPGSPLIDAIPVAACAPAIPTDQRGFPRPADGNNDGSTSCDIGAVEVQPTPAVTAIPAAPAFTG